MNDLQIEALFREFWLAAGYSAPPGTHALMTHVAWGRFLLERIAAQHETQEVSE